MTSPSDGASLRGDSWNRFDGIVVIASWIATIEPSLWPFRIVRALRMLRAAARVPELRVLVETIVTSLVSSPFA